MEPHHRRQVLVTALCVSLLALTVTVVPAVGGQSASDYSYFDDFADGQNDWSAGTESGTTLTLPAGVTANSPGSNFGPGGGDFVLDVKSGSGEFRTVAISGNTYSARISTDYQNQQIEWRAPGQNAQSMSANINKGQTYTYRIEFNKTKGEYTFEIDELGFSQTETSTNNGWTGPIGLTSNWNGDTVFDWVGYAQGGIPRQVSGEVTDESGTGLDGVTITATNETWTNTTTTDSGGYYNITLYDGNWTLEASKPGYIPNSTNITVDGQKTVDIVLENQSERLDLDVDGYMKHGSEQPYRVSASVDGNSINVTENASVSSSNSDVVFVDSLAYTLQATSNRSVAESVTITASYTTADGTELQAAETVVVANQTVDNIDILPPANKFAAVLEGGTDDNRGDRSYVVVFLATALGSAVALLATSLAGVAVIPIAVGAGWLAGFASLEVAIAANLSAVFVGLNLAANIDYGSFRNR